MLDYIKDHEHTGTPYPYENFTTLELAAFRNMTAWINFNSDAFKNFNNGDDIELLGSAWWWDIYDNKVLSTVLQPDFDPTNAQRALEIIMEKPKDLANFKNYMNLIAASTENLAGLDVMTAMLDYGYVPNRHWLIVLCKV